MQYPGKGELCRYDEEKLENIWARYENYDRKKMIELTCTFPEWEKNKPKYSSKKIPLKDILDALDMPEQYEDILQDANEILELESFFGHSQLP